jgi:hypothetical protein
MPDTQKLSKREKLSANGNDIKFDFSMEFDKKIESLYQILNSWKFSSKYFDFL